MDLERFGIRDPRINQTELWERQIPNHQKREEFFERCLGRNLVRKIADPEDIWEGFRLCIIWKQLTGSKVIDGGHPFCAMGLRCGSLV